MAAAAGTRGAVEKDLSSKSILGPGVGRLAKGPDLSQLKPPIKTSVSGTRQVIHAMETATGEVKNLLLDEINLMYECKTCQSVFRSLANLISHKRTFCKARYNEVLHLYKDKEGSEAAALQTVVIEAEPVECAVDGGVEDLTDYSPSVELLKTAGILEDIQGGAQDRRPPCNRLLPHHKPGLKSVVARLKARLDGTEANFYENMSRNFEAPKPSTVVHLESMFETDNALMQSWRYKEEGETVGEQYMGWQEAEDDKQRLMVGPQGQVVTSREIVKLVSGPDGGTYSVRVPRDEWETAPADQVQSSQVKFPCPKCKRKFGKVSNVFNHMVKDHAKTMKEAKQMNQSIRDQAVVTDGSKKKPGTPGVDFRVPVKPCEIKLKNFTLKLKGSMNLCEKLQTHESKRCPVLDNYISDSKETLNGEVKEAQMVNSFVAERDEQEKDEPGVPDHVERAIMKHVNRRKVQCKLCDKKFSRSRLVRNHVAWEHLRLARWKCAVCCHTSWNREHCVKHVDTKHGVRDVEGGVIEQPVEKYFGVFIEEPTMDRGGSNDISDVCEESVEETKSTDTEVEEDDNFVVTMDNDNGSDIVKEDVENADDKYLKNNVCNNVENEDSDDGEISFKETSLSPNSTTSVPSSGPTGKRKRSPSDPQRSTDDSPTSASSLLSKVMMTLPMFGWSSPPKEQPSPAPPTLSKVARFKVPDDSTVDILDTPHMEVQNRHKVRPPKRARSKSKDMDIGSNSCDSVLTSDMSSSSSNSSRSGSVEPSGAIQ